VKKGANLYCFPSEWSVERVFQTAKEAGFDGVELDLTENGIVTLDTSDKELARIAELAASFQLELPSVSTALFWRYRFTDADMAVRRRALDICKRLIEVASALRVDTVLVVPGVVDEHTPYDAAYERAQSALAELSDYAAAHSVVIAVENVWNRFLLSPLEMKRFVEEIHHPALQVYFDVGNVLAFGFPEQWIRILGGLIRRVHVKDFRQDVGNVHGFTSLLHGDVDWTVVMKALRDVGYDSYLTAEIPPNSRFPSESLAEMSRALDVIRRGGGIPC
jgi:L-ribulose-5-phosphate 3-epimerase